jgi:hypothetical protein
MQRDVKQTHAKRFSLLLLIAALACSGPSSLPPPKVTPAASSPTAKVTPSPLTLVPTPTIPAGWQEYRSDAPRLSFGYPPDWEVSAEDDGTLDVRQTGGDGWMQISEIGDKVGNPFGLAYVAGMSGDSILGALLAAAREDGTFGDPQHISTRRGVSMSASEGHNDIRNEQTIIGAIGLADRALVIIAHGGGLDEDWPTLIEIYHQMVGSLSDY